MSKYTTELRFILETYAGLSESEGNDSVENIITLGMPKLFDFDFPIFDEAYRPVLERKIINRYYTREIGYETVGRWKLALKTKLNEIMPYYNKLYNSELIQFNPLYTHNITKTGNKTGNQTGEKTGSLTGQQNVTKDNYEDTRHNQTNTNANTNYNLHSDTPQGGLTGIDTETYLSDANKTTDNGTNTVTFNHDISLNADERTSNTEQTTQNETVQNTAEYLETVVGYEGKNASKALMEYRQTFLNIDVQILDELNKLFMCIW